MKRILYVIEILICIGLAFLAVWNWKMFYREDFAARDAFIHVPALITYGLLVVILVIKFAKYKPQPEKMTVKAYLKLIGIFFILAAVFLAATLFCGLSEASPVYLQDLTKAELKAYYLRDAVKSFGGASARIWPFTAAAVWLSDLQ